MDLARSGSHPPETSDPGLAGFGTLRFDSDGSLAESTTFPARTASQLPPTGPDGDLLKNRIYFNPPAERLQSDPTAEDGQNPDLGPEPVEIRPSFQNLTQFAGTSGLEVGNQNGNAQGRLQSLSFDDSGVLVGSYDNGESRDLAQIAVTTFRNPAGLEKTGNTYFNASANSGRARTGVAGEGGRGSITPGALERSNVDLSAQFAQLISTQRGFQANTRTIRTSDEMIQSVLQLI